MARILCIHGTAHGAWCWYRVLPLLHAAGHQAEALDLPDGDETTLQNYADAILARLDQPTILLAHSAGGYAASAAALKDASHVTRLIGVAAYLPSVGKSLADRRRESPEQPLLPALVRSENGKSFTIEPAYQRAKFYHDCPDEDVALAAQKLRAQPVLPQNTPLNLTRAFLDLPKSYIICDDDRAVPPAQQAKMAAEHAPDSTFHLPSGHSPFFSMPDRLAALIDRIVMG